ncbi:MAG: HlyD family efflux transporter periplasmic adaptor subunit [Planctomycetes bacterium]|nr:HlyD family efflux transporter periplasmic adaptor subunit [Planctomycetota bacterium]
MMFRIRWAVTCVFCLCLLASAVVQPLTAAQDKPAGKSGDKDATPAAAPTVKVEQGKLSNSISVKAVVENDAMSEIEVRLKGWASPLSVEQAVAHGAKVKKDDVLLKFDAEKLDHAVAAARDERVLAGLTIKLAELDLPLAKQQLPLDLQAAEKLKRQSLEDLEQFLKVDKAHDIESAERSLKSAEFNVLTAKDELAQLEKMYKDKDLTEETEQIILKRYQFALESAEFFLRSTKLRTEHTLKTDLPRREDSVKMAAAKATIAWDRAREQLPIEARQKELALEKLKVDDQRARERLADLEHDLAQMTIKAPAAGVVYHGKYSRGQWTSPPATAFQKRGALPANDVVLTIVGTGKWLLHTEVEEKEIGEIQVGQSARFVPTRSPQKKLAGKVQRVASIPESGKFEVVIALTDPVPAEIVAGLTGTVKIMTVQKDNALTVPSSAVFENSDDDTHYVYLPGKTPLKKTVKIGVVSGDRTEIVEGLAASDEILASKP